MAKIIIKGRPFVSTATKAVAVGEEIEVEQGIADRLIAKGLAEEVKAPVAKKAPAAKKAVKKAAAPKEEAE
jgi:hypothetical protein